LQKRNSREPRHELFEQVQLFCEKIDGKEGDARDIAAWSRQARDVAAHHGIIPGDDHDRDRLCLGRGRPDSRGRCCQDDVDVPADQVRREGGQLGGVAAREAFFEEDIFAFHVAELTETLQKDKVSGSIG
jgi:hypothetical protein